MKKAFKTVLSLLVIVSVFSSCDREETLVLEEQNSFTDINKLSQDRLFIDFIEESSKIPNQITDIKKLEELSSKGEALTNNEMEELSRVLGFDNLDGYKEYYNNQKTIMLELNQKYNIESYNEEVIQSLAIKAITENTNLFSGRVTGCASDLSDCGLVAAAGALWGNARCLILDTTVLAGIICHATVMTIYGLRLNGCNDAYAECLDNIIYTKG